ncbi:MAG: DUF3662 domain-containing protein [Anaerolineae bacterium]|nr:DUF3662 domain-containing protein [Anaerolineae bacterium]
MSQHLSRLEAQLERTIEGLFGRLLGHRIRAHDIALKITRAMESLAHSDPDDPSRTIAPDHYVVHLHPDAHQRLLVQHPAVVDILKAYIVELAASTGYHIKAEPRLDLLANAELPRGAVEVTARHTRRKANSTAIMQRVQIMPEAAAPRQPQIAIQGRPPIPLDHSLINIGRSRDNHIVVDDRTVSRHHLQLRLRYGRYVLFDTQSHGGTLVNEVRVAEHILQNGDVIQIGQMRMVYMEETADHEQTVSYDAVDPDQTE